MLKNTNNFFNIISLQTCPSDISGFSLSNIDNGAGYEKFLIKYREAVKVRREIESDFYIRIALQQGFKRVVFFKKK